MLPRNSALVGALLAATSFVVLATGCHNVAPAAAQPPAVAPVVPANPEVQEAAATVVEHSAFDGDSAFALLKKQCDFGPRPIGSPAHEKCLTFLLEEMRKYADQTVSQKFSYRAGGVNLPNTNVIGIFYPKGTTAPSSHPILLMAHWDTRPIADGPLSEQTKNGIVFRFNNGVWRPLAPILGASDAASGVAVLLELAKLFKANPPASGVVMLLDDGEDYGDFEADNNAGDGVELGARYFAAHYKENPQQFGQPTFGILLDMVGGTNAFFPREEISDRWAKQYNDRVYSAAHELGYDKLFPQEGTQSVGDDHVSVNEAGIPTIDIIHPLPYGDHIQSGYTFWHTLQDTPDKCSPKTLKAVGDVVARTVYLTAP